MIPITAGTVFLTFLVFCRVGGCIMLMPGFGSPRVPMQVRVFLAISVTLALAPLVMPRLEADITSISPAVFGQLILSETLIGATIGLIGRFFMLALQFAGTAVAMLVGFSGAEAPVEEQEAAPPIATLLTLTATVLVFITGLHIEMMRALVHSYDVLKVVDLFDPRFALSKLTDAAADAFGVVARIASPFLVFSLVLNFLFGVLNKLTPTIPVYFISGPFLAAGGVVLLFLVFQDALRVFLSGFQNFLANG